MQPDATQQARSQPAPTEVVAEYFARMRAGDTRVAELFHDDAVLIGLGNIVRGRPAIDVFYARSIAIASPAPRQAGPWLVADDRVAVEIFIDLAGGATLHVLDLFVVDAGAIRSLTYFVADHP